MPVKHHVRLSVEEREQLMNILRRKHSAAARQSHARILLKADENGPWLKRQRCIAPTASADFVCRMEDVLEVCQRPQDPRRPVVCLDETTKQLVRETRTPLPMAPGQPERCDYEYERNGVASLFMMCAPFKRLARGERGREQDAHRPRAMPAGAGRGTLSPGREDRARAGQPQHPLGRPRSTRRLIR